MQYVPLISENNSPQCTHFLRPIIFSNKNIVIKILFHTLNRKNKQNYQKVFIPVFYTDIKSSYFLNHIRFSEVNYEHCI